MLMVLRCLGWILMLLAFGVLGVELVSWSQTGHFRFYTFGQLWFNLDASSLNLAQAVTERYISVWLWDSVVSPILLWTALPTLLIPGLVLAESHRLAALFRRFVSTNEA